MSGPISPLDEEAVHTPVEIAPGTAESSTATDRPSKGLSTVGERATEAEVEVAPLVSSTPEAPAAESTSPAAGRLDEEGGYGDRPPLPPSLNMLADSPLTTDGDDRLGFAAYANALAGLLDHPDTATPLTIAISAPWGAGKTSLANMVASRLVNRPLQRGDRPHIVCWFNAWLHDDAPHLGAAFAAEVAKTANRHRTWPRRFFSPIASAMLSPEERWRRRIFIGLGSLVIAVAIAALPSVRTAIKPGSTTTEWIRTVIGQRWAPLIVIALLVLAVWRKVFAAAQATARFVDDPKSQAADGSMREVRDQLGKLIRQAVRNPGRFGSWIKHRWPGVANLVPRLRGRRRLILIVDDLERCRPPRGVEVCEVASQLLGHLDVMTIFVADMSTVAASAEIKYSQLETFSGRSRGSSLSPALVKGAYGRAYLQKMVQIQFELPPTNLPSLRQMVMTSINTPAKTYDDEQSSRDSGKGDRAENTRRKRADKVTSESRISPSTLTWTWTWTAVGAVVAIATVIITVVFTLDTPSTKNNNKSYNSIDKFLSPILSSTVLIWVGVISAGIAIVQVIYVLILNRRRRSAQQIDDEIRARDVSTEDVESLKAAVLESDAARRGGAELTSQRFERFVADDSVLRKQAESEILKFLPEVPRDAKRLVNHLRLLLVVASERKMLGGTPRLRAAHLGKWMVLLERWPELGFAIRANPSLLTDIEKTVRNNPEQLADIHQLSSLGNAEMSHVKAFFKSRPTLASLAVRLIYCLPASPRKLD